MAESNKEKLGVTVSLDYCFMTPLEKSEGTCPVLIMYDNLLEAFWALPVSSKGVVKYAVDWCVNASEQAGYFSERLILKSDDDVSIVALKKAVAASRKGEIPLIETPVHVPEYVESKDLLSP